MSDNTTVNGVEVTDIESLYEGMSHLQEDYNDGDIYLAEEGTVLCIKARSRTLPNHVTRLVQNVPQIRFTTISVKDGQAYVEVRNSDE